MKFQSINWFDFDKLKERIAGSNSFKHFYVDNFLEEEFAHRIHDSFPSYVEAVRIGTSFSAVNENKKTQISDFHEYPPAIYELYQVLTDDKFVSMVSNLFGIENLIADPSMLGGGIHETNSGGHLDVHVDFNYNKKLNLHRRINLIIYFNHDWHISYGGNIDLWDVEVKNCIDSYAPIFNRVIGFETNDVSWHGVTTLSCPPDRTRKSFAIYYYTKEAPIGWDGTTHSTIFKARPNEYWKRYIAMPFERMIWLSRVYLKRLLNIVQ